LEEAYVKIPSSHAEGKVPAPNKISYGALTTSGCYGILNIAENATIEQNNVVLIPSGGDVPIRTAHIMNTVGYHCVIKGNTTYMGGLASTVAGTTPSVTNPAYTIYCGSAIASSVDDISVVSDNVLDLITNNAANPAFCGIYLDNPTGLYNPPSGRCYRVSVVGNTVRCYGRAASLPATPGAHYPIDYLNNYSSQFSSTTQVLAFSNVFTTEGAGSGNWPVIEYSTSNRTQYPIQGAYPANNYASGYSPVSWW
jgi:hypothetical protein